MKPFLRYQLVLLVSFFFSVDGIAGAPESASIFKKEIHLAVQKYFKSVQQSSIQGSVQLFDFKGTNNDRKQCEPRRRSCLRSVCDNNPSLCDSDYELREVAQACKGVEGDCFDNICTRNPSMCDWIPEVKELAEACRDTSGQCVRAVCETTPRLCDWTPEVKELAAVCKDADGDCVSHICRKNPSMCDWIPEVSSVVKACNGD